MADGSGHHEEMPDQVPVPKLRIGYKEEDPYGVEQPSRGQPDQARRRHHGKRRIDGEDDDPAHKEIEACREKGVNSPFEDFHRDPGGGEAPDETEKCPAPRALLPSR